VKDLYNENHIRLKKEIEDSEVGKFSHAHGLAQ
jgi:hypothetical protein